MCTPGRHATRQTHLEIRRQTQKTQLEICQTLVASTRKKTDTTRDKTDTPRDMPDTTRDLCKTQHEICEKCAQHVVVLCEMCTTQHVVLFSCCVVHISQRSLVVFCTMLCCFHVVLCTFLCTDLCANTTSISCCVAHISLHRSVHDTTQQEICARHSKISVQDPTRDLCKTTRQ